MPVEAEVKVDAVVVAFETPGNVEGVATPQSLDTAARPRPPLRTNRLRMLRKRTP